ncbi:hypothetical protein C8R47DRAFT_1329023 [Mycena vitilis]|nr:hypothetical protein C8R47DRAFT_1329023 [Mycena vitilis]
MDLLGLVCARDRWEAGIADLASRAVAVYARCTTVPRDINDDVPPFRASSLFAWGIAGREYSPTLLDKATRFLDALRADDRLIPQVLPRATTPSMKNRITPTTRRVLRLHEAPPHAAQAPVAQFSPAPTPLALPSPRTRARSPSPSAGARRPSDARTRRFPPLQLRAPTGSRCQRALTARRRSWAGASNAALGYTTVRCLCGAAFPEERVCIFGARMATTATPNLYAPSCAAHSTRARRAAHTFRSCAALLQRPLRRTTSVSTQISRGRRGCDAQCAAGGWQ